jgi:hypothetical protein
MSRTRGHRDEYDWMLGLSPEGWAWEFLRRNPDYRRDYIASLHAENRSLTDKAAQWGLLEFVDPDIDARSAAIFWTPATNISVLSLETAGERHSNGLSGIKCKVAVLVLFDPDVRHVLFSSEGRFLQLLVTGQGALTGARYVVDALPEYGKDRKLTALRRLADLTRYKWLRPHLYSRQKRGPRLAHLVRILDSHARDPAHRAIAREVFGVEQADNDWDNLRDHVRRAIAAARKLAQGGYLDFLN